jgi:hypothetical protein
MDSYDVRFWDTKKIADNASGGRYRVRSAVNGQEHCKSFKNKTLADAFLDDLKDAARDRRPFSPHRWPCHSEMRRSAAPHWARRGPAGEQAAVEGLRDGGPAADPQLGVDVEQVGLDGGLGDEQPGGRSGGR